jgi:hypothetical protein
VDLIVFLGFFCFASFAWTAEFISVRSDVELAANMSAEKLWLIGPAITDEGLRVFEKMPQVLAIGFGDGDVIGDEGVAHLKSLSKLVELHLDSPRITDVGLAHLKGLKNLEVLTLTGPQITDASIAHLKGLVKLRSLFIPRTAKVSEVAMRDLAKALPNCDIKR